MEWCCYFSLIERFLVGSIVVSDAICIVLCNKSALLICKHLRNNGRAGPKATYLALTRLRWTLPGKALSRASCYGFYPHLLSVLRESTIPRAVCCKVGGWVVDTPLLAHRTYTVNLLGRNLIRLVEQANDYPKHPHQLKPSIMVYVRYAGKGRCAISCCASYNVEH